MSERCFCCISFLCFQPLNWNMSVTFRYKLVRQMKHVMINVQCVKITEWDLHVLQFCGVVRNIISDYSVMFWILLRVTRATRRHIFSARGRSFLFGNFYFVSATEPKTAQNANNESWINTREDFCGKSHLTSDRLHGQWKVNLELQHNYKTPFL